LLAATIGDALDPPLWKVPTHSLSRNQGDPPPRCALLDLSRPFRSKPLPLPLPSPLTPRLPSPTPPRLCTSGCLLGEVSRKIGEEPRRP
jgi:hypothetical protein